MLRLKFLKAKKSKTVLSAFIKIASESNCIDSLAVSRKAFKTVLPFLSFKGFKPSIFGKTSITHNNCLTFRSAAQILSINFTYTPLLFNFLFTGLFSSSASSPFTLTRNPVFCQKTYETYLLMLFGIYQIYNFQQFHELFL